VKAKKKLEGRLGENISAVPFVPPPMGGTEFTSLPRYMADSALWLSSLPDYPLSGYCAELSELLLKARREQEKGGGGNLWLATMMR
jgi:hypothetical protein